MPTYAVTDPTTGKKVRLTGDSPPTEQELNDIFAKVNGGTDAPAPDASTPATPPSTPQEPGFFRNVGADLSKRASNVVDIMRPKIDVTTGQPESMAGTVLKAPQRLALIAGQGAGAVNDFMTEGTKSLYRNLVPENTQKAISGGVNGLMNTGPGQVVVGGIKKAQELGSQYTQAYPESAAAAGGIANIVGAGMGVEGTVGAGKAVAAVGKEGVNIAKDVVGPLFQKSPAQVDKELKFTVKKGIEKSLMTTADKNNPQAVQRYVDNATESVKDIVKNKDTLSLTTPEGDAVTGVLPQNRWQLMESVNQRKAANFKKYDAERIAKGDSPAAVDLNPLADKLEAFGNDPVMKIENPKAADYALEKAKAYRAQKVYNADQAQRSLTELNRKYDDFLRAPSPEKAVDVISGNNIRDAMYQAIGPEYEQYRKTFGALSDIEKDATRRAVQQVSKMGGPGWLDILSGSEFIAGLATMSPHMMARGGMLEGLNVYRKYMRNPDRFIKNMFVDADKIITKSGQTGPQSKTLQALGASQE
jgi:hypothetical protein